MATQLEDDFLEDDPDLILDEEEPNETADDGDDAPEGDDEDHGESDEPGDQGEDEVDVDVITFGGTTVEAKDEPAAVKSMREHIKNLERDLRAAKGQPKPDPVGERPRLEDFEFDDDKHAEAVELWVERKRAAKDQDEQRQAVERRQAERWQAQERDLNANYGDLRATGKEAARATVEDAFGAEPFAYLVKAAGKNAAPFILALGNAPDKRAELKALADGGDWAEFIAAAAVMAQGVNVERRKPTTQPERVRGGTPGGGGARKDAHRERLEKEAERTGDYSALVRYESKQTENR